MMAAGSRRTGARRSGSGSRRSSSGRSSSGARRSTQPSRSRQTGRAAQSSRYRGAPAKLHVGQQIVDWVGDVFKIVVVVIVILYCISMTGKAYEAGYSIFYEEAVDEEGSGVEIEITITEDMSVAQIGTYLEEAGLLLDGSVFVYQEMFSSSHGQITAGTYTLSTEMTPSDIISALAENYVEPAEEEETSAAEETADGTAEDTAESEAQAEASADAGTADASDADGAETAETAE